MKRLYIFLILLILCKFPNLVYTDSSVDKLQKKIHDVVEKAKKSFIFIGGGSGVIISKDGYALTNFHVVSFVKRFNVTVAEGKTYIADVVGLDPYGDIALIKLQNAENLDYIPLGDSDKMECGDYVVALGNPFLLGSTNNQPITTFGIISSMHRTKWMYDGRFVTGAYLDILQVDASVNPGNSGGPLLNLQGELIGINGMIDTRFANRINSGVAYAISINIIKNFLDDLKSNNIVYHGTIKGLYVDSHNPNATGAIVSRIKDDSPASEIGFIKNDVVTTVDDKIIHNGNDFLSVIESLPAGREVKIKWQRNDEQFEKKVILQKKKLTSIPYIQEVILSGRLRQPYIGIKVKDIENDEYEDMLRVVSVEDDSPAKEAGILDGDIITHIDNYEIICKAIYDTILYFRKPKKKFQMKILRDGEEIDVEVTPR